MADQSAKVPAETREPRLPRGRVAGRTLRNRWSGIPPSRVGHGRAAWVAMEQTDQMSASVDEAAVDFTQCVGCAGFASWDWINRRRARDMASLRGSFERGSKVVARLRTEQKVDTESGRPATMADQSAGSPHRDSGAARSRRPAGGLDDRPDRRYPETSSAKWLTAPTDSATHLRLRWAN